MDAAAARARVEIGERLSIADVVRVAREGAEVVVSPRARENMERSRAVVDRIIRDGRVVYGITTGVGDLAAVRISPEQAASLQLNVVRSHSAGVGESLPEEAVRAMMLLRAHALALGYSGVRPQIVDLLVAMLNRRVHPVVPSQGSVGASGDLAPLAHLALVLVGEGEAVTDGRRLTGGEALARAGLQPVVLEAKEGVALINGTQGMTALLALAVHDARMLAVVADIAGAMTFEALRGLPDAFDPLLHQVRPHPGQAASAAVLRRLIAGSEILARPRSSARVQDAYALRCMPQVHGACRDALGYVAGVVDVEINSATDNPLVFADAERVLSGGNFHGQPVALAADVLAVATSGLASISERRIERLVNPALSGLPAFLTPDGGLHSGLMLAQYTAAALVSENKVLCHPASVDSIPTSAGQEDHVSMGMIAARKAARVVAHTGQVLAIELVCAAQALEFHRPARPGAGTGAAYAAVREVVPRLEEDRALAPDLEAAVQLVRSGRLAAAVEGAVGEVR
ncbi:MAG: histidine ammonia-lyase [Armatimonadota bacterium]|nr:histidine ammonia-lyase [Armatimonadota bacterium]MDR7611902.1 histidine ammonia-lyase [Armatimonadota bacterium]